jgi:hypothetical protein
MVDPIIAPYAQTYTQHSPYLSLDEYRLSPNAVNTQNLVLGGLQAAQDAALANVITSGSGWADIICHQVLAATSEIYAGYPRVQNDGSLNLPLPFNPIIAVTGFAIGTDPSSLTAAPSLTGIAIDRSTVRVPPALLSQPSGMTDYAPPGIFPAQQSPYTTLSYTAGFANGFLTAPASSGATALVLDNTTGMFPGMTLTANDPAAQAYEPVTIASVVGLTVNLVAPLLHAHVAGVNVSALPPAAKQAVILLTTALIKKRGSVAFGISSPAQKPTAEIGYPSGSAEERTATGLLNEWIRRA